MKFRSTFLLRLVISSFLLFSIPFLIVFLYFYPTNQKILKDEIVRNNYNTIKYIQNNMDLQLDNIYKIPHEFANNKLLRNFYLTENRFNQIQAIEEISKYISTNSFVSDAFLYVFQQNRLYAKQGIYTGDEFGKTAFIYQNWDYESMKRDLMQLKTPAVRPAEYIQTSSFSSGEFVSFLYPIPVGSSSPYGCAIILVEEKTLHNLMKKIMDKYNGNIIITDKQGNIITSLEKCSYLASADFLHVSAVRSPTDTAAVTLDGKSYLCAVIPSEKSSWNYIGLVPVENALHDLKQLQTKTLLLIAACILLGLLLGAYFLYMNYNPIKSLTRFVKSSFNNSSSTRLPVHPLNEIQTIEYAFKHLSETSKTLNDEIYQNVPAVKDSMLQKLISGQFSEIKDFNAKGAKVGIAFLKPVFIVALIKIQEEDKEGSQAMKTALHTLHAMRTDFFSPVDIYFAPDIRKNCILSIANASSEDCSPIKNIFLHMQDTLLAQDNLRTFIGIGSFTDHIGDLQNSYILASYTIDYLLTKKADTLSFYENISRIDSSAESYPIDVLYNLVYAILRKDKEKTFAWSDRIIKIIHTHSTPLHIVKALYIDTMQVILKHLSQYDPNISKTSVSKFNPLTATRVYSSDEMTEIIYAHVENLCSFFALDNLAGSNSNKLMDNIVSYIHKNYLNPELSLQSIADEFDMSVSNVSHFFKNKTGCNISQYINDIRIKEAKRLLTDTEEPVEKIACKLCYSNASSFTRVFKRTVGVTPGDFRVSKPKG